METAVTITAVVLGYGIPIFLGVQSWRNGHREWFWSIILATFGILGIFGIWLSSIKIVEGDIAVVIGIVSGLVCLFGFYIASSGDVAHRIRSMPHSQERENTG